MSFFKKFKKNKAPATSPYPPISGKTKEEWVEIAAEQDNKLGHGIVDRNPVLYRQMLGIQHENAVKKALFQKIMAENPDITDEEFGAMWSEVEDSFSK